MKNVYINSSIRDRGVLYNVQECSKGDWMDITSSRWQGSPEKKSKSESFKNAIGRRYMDTIDFGEVPIGITSDSWSS